MFDFVVLNIGNHRSLHLEGHHTAAPAAQLSMSGLLVGRLAAWTRIHGGGAICISSSTPAVQPPCRPPRHPPACVLLMYQLSPVHTRQRAWASRKRNPI